MAVCTGLEPLETLKSCDSRMVSEISVEPWSLFGPFHSQRGERSTTKKGMRRLIRHIRDWQLAKRPSLPVMKPWLQPTKLLYWQADWDLIHCKQVLGTYIGFFALYLAFRVLERFQIFFPCSQSSMKKELFFWTVLTVWCPPTFEAVGKHLSWKRCKQNREKRSNHVIINQ